MMHINLYINLYNINNQLRYDEIVNCLNKNIANNIISKIYILDEGFNFNKIKSKKLVIIPVQRRFKFSDFTNYLEEHAINIIANNDIVFKNGSFFLKKLFLYKRIFLCLTRYELDGKHFRADFGDSHDAWVFKGKPDFLKLCSYFPGTPGCDNRLAYDAWRHNYVVVNPTKSIRTIHFHSDSNRSYTDKDRVSRPYLAVLPTGIVKAFLIIIFSFIFNYFFTRCLRFKYEYKS